jgi:hypothetical protein
MVRTWLMLGVCTAALASSITYNYIGNTFNECNGYPFPNGACPANYATDFIIASATFSTPLAGNLSAANLASSPNLLAWTIGDSLAFTSFSSTDTNASAELTNFIFSTNFAGGISGWTMTAETDGFTKGASGNSELGTFNPPFNSSNNTPEADFLIGNGGNITIFGWNVGNSLPGTWTETLNGFQGGTTSAPVTIGGLPIVGLNGTIAGLGTEDYYTFYWGGGAFSATAAVTGASSGASYVFSAGVSGSCNSVGNETLNSGDGFSETISVGNLAPGQYCIGLDATSASDPNFSLTFSTPVSSTPEPGTFVLLSAGLAIAAVRQCLARPNTRG